MFALIVLCLLWTCFTSNIFSSADKKIKINILTDPNSLLAASNQDNRETNVIDVNLDLSKILQQVKNDKAQPTLTYSNGGIKIRSDLNGFDDDPFLRINSDLGDNRKNEYPGLAYLGLKTNLGSYNRPLADIGLFAGRQRINGPDESSFEQRKNDSDIPLVSINGRLGVLNGNLNSYPVVWLNTNPGQENLAEYPENTSNSKGYPLLNLKAHLGNNFEGSNKTYPSLAEIRANFANSYHGQPIDNIDARLVSAGSSNEEEPPSDTKYQGYPLVKFNANLGDNTRGQNGEEMPHENGNDQSSENIRPHLEAHANLNGYLNQTDNAQLVKATAHLNGLSNGFDKQNALNLATNLGGLGNTQARVFGGLGK